MLKPPPVSAFRKVRRGFAGRSVFISAGHGDHRKGFDLFLDAARGIMQRLPDAQFVWLGALGGWAQGLAAKAQAGGLPLLCPGFVTDSLAWYAAARAYLLTSRQDPGPTTVIHAAAMGVPFVGYATDIGLRGVADHLGRFVPADRPADFVRAALDLARRDNRAERRHLRRVVLKATSFGSYTDAILAIVSPVPEEFAKPQPVPHWHRRISHHPCALRNVLMDNRAGADHRPCPDPQRSIARAVADHRAGGDLCRLADFDMAQNDCAPSDSREIAQNHIMAKHRTQHPGPDPDVDIRADPGGIRAMTARARTGAGIDMAKPRKDDSGQTGVLAGKLGHKPRPQRRTARCHENRNLGKFGQTPFGADDRNAQIGVQMAVLQIIDHGQHPDAASKFRVSRIFPPKVPDRPASVTRKATLCPAPRAGRHCGCIATDVPGA